MRESKFFWILGVLIWLSVPAYLAWLLFAASWVDFQDPILRAHVWFPVLLGSLFAGAAALGAFLSWRRLHEVPERAYGSDALAMLLVAGVLALLGLVSWPAFGGLFKLSAEAADKADLAAVRQAFAEYAAQKGRPPKLEALVEEGIMPALPRLRFYGVHPKTRGSVNLEPGVYTDSGRWGYSVEASTPVFIDCTHTDHRKGLAWNSY